MKTIFKMFVMALILFGATLQTNAQEKYDFAIVSYFRDVPDPLVLISLNGENFESVTVQKQELNGKPWGISMTPLLIQVNKLQDQGWEVIGGMQTSGLPSQSMFYFTLRKKRK